MKEGLLWFDNDPVRSLEEKVQRAERRYRQKYGRQPNVCYVHPSLLTETREMGAVRVAPLSTVLLHHFWVGEEEGGGGNGKTAGQPPAAPAKSSLLVQAERAARPVTAQLAFQMLLEAGAEVEQVG